MLNLPDWSIEKNDAWVNDGIANRQRFYLASKLTDENFTGTVFGREIQMLQDAGYIKVGNYMWPPLFGR